MYRKTAVFQQGLNDEVDALYNRLKNCPVGTTPVYGNQPIFTCGNVDRCNNVSGMAIGFAAERMQDYIEETEKYYPELLKVIKGVPEYNNAAWLLSYQIRSLLLTAKRIPR